MSYLRKHNGNENEPEPSYGEDPGDSCLPNAEDRGLSLAYYLRHRPAQPLSAEVVRKRTETCLHAQEIGLLDAQEAADYARAITTPRSKGLVDYEKLMDPNDAADWAGQVIIAMSKGLQPPQ